jgi:hypothetical protein
MDNSIFDLRKALDTSSTNGNNVLDPILLSKIISEQARRMPTLRNAIKRVPWGTNFYTWDTEVTPGIGQTATDGATINLIDATFLQNQVKMSYFYSAAFITNPAIKAAEELVDVVSLRVAGMTKSVLRQEGNVIYNGDASNASNPGLIAAINAGPNGGVIGQNASASRGLFAAMEQQLRGEGYEPGCLVVTPNLYAYLKEVAYNNVRFTGLDANSNIQLGFSQAQATLSVGGVPVIMDPYAGSLAVIANVSMVAGSGATNFKFSADGANAVAGRVYNVAGQDYVGGSWVAPIIKVSGTVVTNYTLNFDGSVTFAATPAATPTASLSYLKDNAFMLSLDPADLVIAEQMGLTIEQDLARPVQTDSIPLRTKMYSVLAVRNPKAHVLAQGVSLPPFANF